MSQVVSIMPANTGVGVADPATPQGIGWAVGQLWQGRKLRRAGWNGKGMFLILVPGSKDVGLRATSPYARAEIGERVTIDPHIDMYTAKGTMQPGWLASQADLLAADWEVC